MRRTYAYSISLIFAVITGIMQAQDTVVFPLKIRAGIDLAGPATYFSNRDNFSLEGYVSFDKNEKMAFVLEGGYLDYKFSQYNYDYLSRGIFLRAGTDFNLLRPEISNGSHWAGIGLRYGFSLFNAETPSFTHENYWGNVNSSIDPRTSTGHFLEVAPGIRTEVFRNFSIGWTLRLRLLVSGGGGKDLRPIYLPGFGQGGKSVNAGINYYLTWSIPFKKIRVIIKPEEPEVPEDEEEFESTRQEGF